MNMWMWNYVATIQAPTTVTHSCVGCFTGPKDTNLIIANCTQIKIHKVSFQDTGAVNVYPMLRVPINGRIETLEILRPRGLDQDILFVATEETHKFCLMQWVDGAVVKRFTTNVAAQIHNRPYKPQIGIVDPDCRLIGFHADNGLFNFIPLDEGGKLGEAFDIRMEDQVMEFKFLYGCEKPTIVVLNQDLNGGWHVKTYVVDLICKTLVAGPWYQERIHVMPAPWNERPLLERAYIGDGPQEFLVPVDHPLCGVLVIGGGSIHYCGDGVRIRHRTELSFTRAYGRCGDSKYLLGDHNGILHLLELECVSNKVTGIRTKALGGTPIASSISHIKDSAFFVGSRYCDSQLIEINRDPDAKGSHVKVCETFVNLGPILDFCVVNFEKERQVQVVTCSGAYKDGSLCIVRKIPGIKELASVELPEGIKEMWSLRSTANNTYDSFLVVSNGYKTCILEMNSEGVLVETQMEGLSSDAETLFCQFADYDQLVQVTSKSVRLVSLTTRQILGEWLPPKKCLINAATANATEVLLAIGGNQLVHLTIGNGVLTQGQEYTDVASSISCLNITTTCDQSDCHLAAVGRWTDNNVNVHSLPSLQLIATQHLEGVPRSVLMCSFEGVSYLLCGLGDGHIWNFVLRTDEDELELVNSNKVRLGTEPIELRICSSSDIDTRVFAASYSQQTIIHSSGKKLHDSKVSYVKGLRSVCPFNPDSFFNSVAIATEDKLIVGTMVEARKYCADSIKLVGGQCARCICHQEQTRTFAICSSSAEYSGIHLLDDRSFDIKSSFELDTFEYGLSILSCTFSGDNEVYYCIGTAFVTEEVADSTKGRILVFAVKCGNLELIANQETEGGVYSLNAFKGRLLAAINNDLLLYKWMIRDEGAPHLELQCGHHDIRPEEHHRDIRINPFRLGPFVETRGDIIVCGDPNAEMFLLTLTEHVESVPAFQVLRRREGHARMSAIDMLDDDISVIADKNFELFVVRNLPKRVPMANMRRRRPSYPRLGEVGRYYLGDVVNRVRHGSFLMPFPNSDESNDSTAIFGTVNGAIGVMASLSEEKYILLQKLQTAMSKMVRVWGLEHNEWRSFSNRPNSILATNFIDGDLIAVFLKLTKNQMEKISNVVGVPVEQLKKIVGDLARLHC